jgi:hypothetical protein
VGFDAVLADAAMRQHNAICAICENGRFGLACNCHLNDGTIQL